MRRAPRVPRGDAVGLVRRIVVSPVVIGCGGGGRAAGATRKLFLFPATSVQGGTQGVRLRVSELLLEIGEDKIRELVAGNRRVAPNGEARFQLGRTLPKLVLRRSELRRGDERDAALAAADDRQEPGQGAAAVALRQDRALRGGRQGARGGPGPRPRPDAARPRLSPEAQSSSRGPMGEGRRVPIDRSLGL